MNLTCGTRSIKYLMFIFNFFFVITGIALIAVGASIKTYYTQYDLFLDGKYFSLPNLLIATGILVFIISFLGCYGAMKESWLMLMAFSVLLGVIFILEFSAGIAGYVLRDKTSSYLEETLTDTMFNYNENHTEVRKMWDLIQTKFECCGVNSATDWEKALNSKNLPVSCCPSVSGSVGQFYCNAFDHTTINTTTTTVPSNTTTSSTTTNSTVSPSITTPSPTTLTSTTTNTSITTANSTVSPSNTTPSPTTLTSTTTNTSITTTNSTVSPSNTPSSPTTLSIPHPPSANLRSNSAGLPNSDISTSTDYPNSTSVPYSTGCEAAFGTFVKAHAVDIGGVGFALAVIQLIGIGFSYHLSRQLRYPYQST